LDCAIECVTGLACGVSLCDKPECRETHEKVHAAERVAAPDPPTFEELLAATENMIRDLRFVIAKGGGDTMALRRYVRYQEEQFRALALMRKQHAPNPSVPLP
jgi:hypothetical protein